MNKHDEPELKRDWIGLRVRLTRQVRNYHFTFPKGATGVVDGYASGKKGVVFESDPCEYCGIKARIGGLHRSDVEILTPREEWPNTKGKGRSYRP